MKGKGFIGERGFDKAISPFKEIVKKRGWELLCSHREPVLAEVVKEFYANMVQPRGKSVFVRGEWVSFDREDINKVFNLKLAKDGHRFK